MSRRLVAFALVTSVASFACHRAPTGPTAGPSNKAEVPVATATADDVLGFLPLDSDLVAGFDATAMRSSALWAEFEPQIVAALGDVITKVRDRCGFDPMKTVERVTIGGKLISSEKFEGVIVVRGVSGQKTLDCIAQEAQKEAAVTNEGGVLTITDRTTHVKMVSTIVGASTMVIQIAQPQSTATLPNILRSGAALRTSPAFMQLFDRREPGAAAWGMINGNSPLLDQAAEAGARPKSIDGTLRLSDKFIGALRITFASPADADKIVQQVGPLAKNFSAMFEKLEIKGNGAMVQADVVATEAQLRALAGMLGAFR